MSANDNPFKVKDRISVIRERHGWHDGRVCATIVSVHCSKTGTFSYSAVTDDGDQLEIRHTRDANLLKK